MMRAMIGMIRKSFRFFKKIYEILMGPKIVAHEERICWILELIKEKQFLMFWILGILKRVSIEICYGQEIFNDKWRTLFVVISDDYLKNPGESFIKMNPVPFKNYQIFWDIYRKVGILRISSGRLQEFKREDFINLIKEIKEKEKVFKIKNIEKLLKEESQKSEEGFKKLKGEIIEEGKTILENFRKFRNSFPPERVENYIKKLKEIIYGGKGRILREEIFETAENIREIIENFPKELERKREGILETLKEKLKEYAETNENLKNIEKTEKELIREKIRRILNNPFVERLEIKRNVLMIFTGEIEIKGIKLGKFRIEIDFGKNSILMFNLTRTFEGRYHHPHIDGDGVPCFGKNTKKIRKLLEERDLENLIRNLVGFLISYDSSSSYFKL